MNSEVRPSSQRRGSDRRGRMVVVTLRGGAMLGAAIVLFSAAYIAGWPELLILATFSAIPPLLALAVVAIRRPRFTVTRSSSPSVVGAGATGSARIHVASDSRVPSAPMRWSDDLPWGPGRTRWGEVPSVNVGARFSLQYDFVPSRRGIFELGPLVVEVADPFGLARGEFAVGSTDRVVVAPQTIDLGLGLTELASDSGSARLFKHRALAGDHDIMTRDYRPGDALHRVHWKASAHHGELMVREDEKRSHAEAVIVVDTRRHNWRDAVRNPSPDRADSESFEWALSMTSSLRDYLIRNGLRVRVVETAVTQLVDAGHSDEFVESLARVRLSYQDGPSMRLIEQSAANVSSLFAVLDAPDVETVNALTEQRASFRFAAAFLTGPANPPLEERLTRAEWYVHRVAAGETVLAAWQSLTAGEHGV